VEDPIFHPEKIGFVAQTIACILILTEPVAKVFSVLGNPVYHHLWAQILVFGPGKWFLRKPKKPFCPLLVPATGGTINAALEGVF